MNAPEQIERPNGTLFSAIALAAAVLAFAGRMPAALQSFKDIFQGFGADLPGITKFVIGFPQLWWILALASIALLVWIIARPRVTRDELARMKLGLVVIFATALIVITVTAWAVFWPIFQLGKAV